MTHRRLLTPSAPAPGAILAAGLLALLTAGCGDGGRARAIEHTRDVPAAGVLTPVPSEVRFGFSGGMPPASQAQAFAWDLPRGWLEVPARAPRAASFQAPGGLDCSLTVLPGAAGGVAANVNRWRGQMGLAPYTEAELAALPRRPMLGAGAVRVEFGGEYSGMGDGPTTDGAKLLGYILAEGSRTIFLKLVGPADAVDPERAAFDALAASLRLTGGTGGDHAAHTPTVPTPNKARTAGNTAPHDDVHATLGAGPGAGSDPLGLSWDVPAGWSAGEERPLRAVTLVADEAAGVECYVVVLGGAGGGVIQNVALWHSQMGLQPPPQGAPPSERSLDVLGQPSPLVELTGQGAAAGRAMLGVICPLDTHTVFIKMTGPEEAVRSHEDAFLAYCRSLSR